jgi:serine protease Do
MDNNQPTANKHKRHSRLLAAASAAVIVVVGLGAFALAPDHQAAPPVPHTTEAFAANTPAKQRIQPPRMLENGAPFSFADLVERVSPAVVSVTVESKPEPVAAMGQMPDNIPEPFRQFFRNFGGQNAVPQKSIGVGSGFIIDKSGYIVTNNHVVDHSSKISVKLPDGRTFEAKLIGTDAATDVALIKVKSDKASLSAIPSDFPTPSRLASSLPSAATWATVPIPISSRSTRRSIAAIPAVRPSICADRSSA